jgi:hypothetical protein
MTFKIHDLMTDVLPETIRWATCPGTSCGGNAFAAASNTGKSGGKGPRCHAASRGGDVPKPPKPGPQQDYTGLALLQRQLQRTLDGARA